MIRIGSLVVLIVGIIAGAIPSAKVGSVPLKANAHSMGIAEDVAVANCAVGNYFANAAESVVQGFCGVPSVYDVLFIRSNLTECQPRIILSAVRACRHLGASGARRFSIRRGQPLWS